MTPDAVRSILASRNLDPYHVNSGIAFDGWHVSTGTITNSGAPEYGVLVQYQSLTDVPPPRVTERIDAYAAVLKDAGVTFRRRGKYILVPCDRPPELAPAAPRPRESTDAYRYDLLARIAIDLSAAIEARRRRGEHVTPDGRAQIARRARSIIEASTEQLESWRRVGR